MNPKGPGIFPGPFSFPRPETYHSKLIIRNLSSETYHSKPIIRNLSFKSETYHSNQKLIIRADSQLLTARDMFHVKHQNTHGSTVNNFAPQKDKFKKGPIVDCKQYAGAPKKYFNFFFQNATAFCIPLPVPSPQRGPLSICRLSHVARDRIRGPMMLGLAKRFRGCYRVSRETCLSLLARL